MLCNFFSASLKLQTEPSLNRSAEPEVGAGHHLEMVAATKAPHRVLRSKYFTLFADVLYCSQPVSETVILEEIPKAQSRRTRCMIRNR